MITLLFVFLSGGCSSKETNDTTTMAAPTTEDPASDSQAVNPAEDEKTTDNKSPSENDMPADNAAPAEDDMQPADSTATAEDITAAGDTEPAGGEMPAEEPTPDDTTQTSASPVVSKDPVTVSYTPKIIHPGETYTGNPVLDAVEYTVNDPNNARGLSTEKNSFSFGAAKDGKPHSITVQNQKKFDSYQTGALAWDNKTAEKILYLTFDCGYEYHNLTSDILDTLKEKNIQAAFFCTLPYLESEPETVTRMIEEGHIVGNHSTNHPADSSSLSRERLALELLGVHNYLRVNYGYESRYFRFPGGVYSENALELVNSVGYRSVFWSIAHADWDPDNQPGTDTSYQTLTSRLHPGAVILLHAMSSDNAAILGDLIDYAHEQGYEFHSLDQYDDSSLQEQP